VSSHLPRAARAGLALSVLLLVPFAVGSGTAAEIQPGTITAAHFRSAVLGEDISYNVYLPAGYDSTAKHYPVLYLLHGRGDSMAAWTQVKAKLDAMIADGRIPAAIAIMPDAPGAAARATTSTRRIAAPIPGARSRRRSRPT
jgi:enterochelin esterase-like enzyme